MAEEETANVTPLLVAGGGQESRTTGPTISFIRSPDGDVLISGRDLSACFWFNVAHGIEQARWAAELIDEYVRSCNGR